MMFLKRISFFRTKWYELQFRPYKYFVLIIVFTWTVFFVFPFPRVTFRIVPPETLPWAEIYWPFRPEKYTYRKLCIKNI
jgi:hypothetical protein